MTISLDTELKTIESISPLSETGIVLTGNKKLIKYDGVTNEKLQDVKLGQEASRITEVMLNNRKSIAMSYK